MTKSIEIGRQRLDWASSGTVLIGAILLGDILFWNERVGVSLAVFVAALCFVVFARSDREKSLDVWARAALAVGAIVAPVIEQVQVLSVVCTLAGVAVFSIWAVKHPTNFFDSAAQHILRLVPFFFRANASGIKEVAVRARTSAQISNGPARLAMGWAFPIVFGGALVALLAAANPIFDRWLLEALPQNWPLDELLWRSAFWGLLAILTWPILQIGTLRLPPIRETQRSFPGLNAASVTNSMVVFNLILGVQSYLDLVYLWGGTGLPDGMSLATYAHRGAYPLVVTALMAGLFALGSRKFVSSNSWLRGLLFLWIGQNIALLMSAAYRLDMYVDAFGLTYLRVAAFIWMGLVGYGLSTVAIQVLFRRPNVWLVRANVSVVFATLYLCCFINFGHFIVQHNLQRDAARPYDIYYLCSFPPTAAGALRDYELQTGTEPCASCPITYGAETRDWRHWGFRSHRVTGYLRANPLSE